MKPQTGRKHKHNEVRSRRYKKELSFRGETIQIEVQREKKKKYEYRLSDS